MGKLKDKQYLDQAAKRFLLALKSGLTESEAFDYEFRGSTLADAYKDKLKSKLEARAMELKKEEEELLERISKKYKLGRNPTYTYTNLTPPLPLPLSKAKKHMSVGSTLLL